MRLVTVLGMHMSVVCSWVVRLVVSGAMLILGLQSARAAGFVVNNTPAPGAIFQTTAGYYGHVGIVETSLKTVWFTLAT